MGGRFQNFGSRLAFLRDAERGVVAGTPGGRSARPGANGCDAFGIGRGDLDACGIGRAEDLDAFGIGGRDDGNEDVTVTF